MHTSRTTYTDIEKERWSEGDWFRDTQMDRENWVQNCPSLQTEMTIFKKKYVLDVTLLVHISYLFSSTLTYIGK